MHPSAFPALDTLRALGFDRLATDHAAEAERARIAAQQMAGKLPATLPPDVEPAHVYRPASMRR